MSTILDSIRKELKSNSDEQTRESGKRFFKEQVKLFGVKTALVSRISKESFKQINMLSKPEIFSLCDQLWRSGYMEESFIACNWSYYVREQYKKDDFILFETWVKKYVSNWASCDTLCNHTLGTFIEMYPQFLSHLKQWTQSDNRWMRRAAAVTLIIPARKGKFLEDIIAIADLLFHDTDDLVQKGYGWMLKAASEAHQNQIFRYVLSRKATMPRTALRYAIEKMPKELKAKAMER